MDIHTKFNDVPGLIDRFRNGEGYQPGRTPSHFKLCLTATQLEYLVNILFEVSQSDQCFRVKYRPKEKSGMYLGRIVMINDEQTGQLWNHLRKDKQLFCSVQDDQFCEAYRDQKKVEKVRDSIKNAIG